MSIADDPSLPTSEPTAAPIRSSRDRLIQLDVLRGIAILLVLGHHPVVRPEEAGRFGALGAAWVRFGWCGVDLFFVLSGFLIGGLIFLEIKRKQDFDLKRFYIRRAFKIMPLYFVFLAISAFFLATGLNIFPRLTRGELIRALGINLVSLQNYLGTPWPHTWSLSVEEHFYFVLPLIIVFLGVRRASGPVTRLPVVPLLAATAIFVCTTIRIGTFEVGRYEMTKDLFPTHKRIDGLFFGVFLAYVYHYHAAVMSWVTRQRLALFLAGLALIAPMTVLELEETWFVPTLGFTFLYLGFGLLLITVVTIPEGVGLSGWIFKTWLARALAYIGVYSYAIYLFHIVIARGSVTRFERLSGLSSLSAEPRWLVETAAYITIAVATGALMSLVIERPTLALRNRLFPPRD